MKNVVRSRAVLLALCLTIPAYAQPSSSERALAEKLFHDGRELLEHGEIAPACEKLRESQRIDPNLSTLLNLAHCHEEQGKTADAWVEFKEAKTLADRSNKRERAEYAEKRARSLEPRLSYLRLRGKVSGKVTIFLDGLALRSSALESPLPVNPGSHRVEALATGFESWSGGVTVPAGRGETTLEVPELERARVARPQAPRQSAERPPPPERLPPNPRIVPGVVAMGLGVGGLVIGSIFGLRAMSQEREADEICPERQCSSQDGIDAHDRAKGAALISSIGFGIGVVASAVGVGLLAWPSDPAPQPRSGPVARVIHVGVRW